MDVFAKSNKRATAKLCAPHHYNAGRYEDHPCDRRSAVRYALYHVKRIDLITVVAEVFRSDDQKVQNECADDCKNKRQSRYGEVVVALKKRENRPQTVFVRLNVFDSTSSPDIALVLVCARTRLDSEGPTGENRKQTKNSRHAISLGFVFPP